MPSKAEICVGHAIGYINGISVLKEGKDGYDSEIDHINVQEILDMILSIDLSEGSYFKTFAADNISVHATIICLLVHEGRGLAWYFNPWGLDADLEYHVDRKVKSPDTKYAIENYEQYMNDWSQGLPISHVMYTLKSMTKIRGIDRLEIINPLYSLPDVGPQVTDGIVDVKWIRKVERTMASCGRGGGSCAVWTVMYKTLVGQIISDLLEENKSIDYINRIVTTQMKKGIIRSLNPMESIGVLAYSETRKIEEKELLLRVFELVPEPYEISSEVDSMNSRYHKLLQKSHREVSFKLRPSKHKVVIAPLLFEFLQNVVHNYSSRKHDENIREIIRIFEKIVSLNLQFQRESDATDFLNYIMILVHCKTSSAYTRFDIGSKPHDTRGRGFTHYLQNVMLKRKMGL